jgi:hypothetical protein
LAVSVQVAVRYDVVVLQMAQLVQNVDPAEAEKLAPNVQPTHGVAGLESASAEPALQRKLEQAPDEPCGT